MAALVGTFSDLAALGKGKEASLAMEPVRCNCYQKAIWLDEYLRPALPVTA